MRSMAYLLARAFAQSVPDRIGAGAEGLSPDNQGNADANKNEAKQL